MVLDLYISLNQVSKGHCNWSVQRRASPVWYTFQIMLCHIGLERCAKISVAENNIHYGANPTKKAFPYIWEFRLVFLISVGFT